MCPCAHYYKAQRMKPFTTRAGEFSLTTKWISAFIVLNLQYIRGPIEWLDAPRAQCHDGPRFHQEPGAVRSELSIIIFLSCICTPWMWWDISVFVLGVAQRSSGSSSGSYEEVDSSTAWDCVSGEPSANWNLKCHYYHPLYGINRSYKYCLYHGETVLHLFMYEVTIKWIWQVRD